MDWVIWLQFTLTGLGTIIALAALFAGIGYFKQGRDQAKLSTISLLKEKIAAFETKLNDQSNDMEDMSIRIKQLEETVEERDKKLAEVLAILQGKDPQMQEVINLMRNYMQTNIPLLETIKTKTIPTIDKLEKFLDKQSPL